MSKQFTLEEVTQVHAVLEALNKVRSTPTPYADGRWEVAKVEFRYIDKYWDDDLELSKLQIVPHADLLGYVVELKEEQQ